MTDTKQLLAQTLEATKAAYDAAKQAEESELCQRLMGVREDLQNLRELVSQEADEKARLEEKISSLEKSLALKAALVRHMGVYWAQGDSDPWCPNCWEHEQRAVHMNPTAVLAGRICACQRCDYSINLDNVSPPKNWPA